MRRLAGAATEMPCPPSVAIALPAVTQLLTSGAALKASSRTTACGPPPENATGMSRPIAADGTISISTSALAVGAMDVPAPHKPGSQHHGQDRPDHATHQLPHLTARPACPRARSQSHQRRRGAPEMTDGGDPEGSPPPTMSFPRRFRRMGQLAADFSRCRLAGTAPSAGAGPPTGADGCGTAPSTRWMSGFICLSC